LVVAGVAALSVLLYPAHDAKAEVALKNVQVYVDNDSNSCECCLLMVIQLQNQGSAKLLFNQEGRVCAD
jgi:hypothetical protein